MRILNRSLLPLLACASCIFASDAFGQMINSPEYVAWQNGDWQTIRKIYEDRSKSNHRYGLSLARLLYVRPEFRNERPNALKALIDAVRAKPEDLLLRGNSETGWSLLTGSKPADSPDIAGGLELLSSTCDAGDYEACSTLSRAYFSGIPGPAGEGSQGIEANSELSRRWFDRFITVATTALEKGHDGAAHALGRRKGSWDTRDEMTILMFSELSTHRGSFYWYGYEKPRSSDDFTKVRELAERWEIARGNPVPDSARLARQLISALKLGDASYAGFSRSSLDWLAATLLAELYVPQSSPQFVAGHAFALKELTAAADRYERTVLALLKSDGLSARDYFESRLQAAFTRYQLQYLVRLFSTGVGKDFLQNLDLLESLLEESNTLAGRIATDFASYGQQYYGTAARLKRYAELNGLNTNASDLDPALRELPTRIANFLDIRDSQTGGLGSIGNHERLQAAQLLKNKQYIEVISRFRPDVNDVLGVFFFGEFWTRLKNVLGERQISFRSLNNPQYDRALKSFSAQFQDVRTKTANFLKQAGQ